MRISDHEDVKTAQRIDVGDEIAALWINSGHWDKKVSRLSIIRPFNQEPEDLVREVVRWVLSHKNLPDHDRERMIEGWARRRRTGLYGELQQTRDLEPCGEIAKRAMFGRDAVA